jgi:hypothetical protein
MTYINFDSILHSKRELISRKYIVYLIIDFSEERKFFRINSENRHLRLNKLCFAV